MGTAIVQNKITIQEYLDMEEQSEQKHEYYSGEVFAMAGTTLEHDRIAINLITAINAFLKTKSCDIYSNDVRVHIPENTLFTYPDAFIICGEPQLMDNVLGTVLNPAVIFDIRSRSTRKYNKLEKSAYIEAFFHLQNIFYSIRKKLPLSNTLKTRTIHGL